ncbi:hypothetical protein AM1H77_04040 [Apilactobacillus micheneri]
MALVAEAVEAPATEAKVNAASPKYNDFLRFTCIMNFLLNIIQYDCNIKVTFFRLFNLILCIKKEWNKSILFY